MTPAESSTFRLLVTRLHERKAWEAANPALAADWTEALREDAHWEYRRELEAAQSRAECDAPHQLRKLGIPARAIDAMIHADASVPALKHAREWACQPAQPFLLLTGGVGTGKTVAAVWTARAALIQAAGETNPSGGQYRAVVKWVDAAELNCLSSFDEADRLFFEDCRRARLLILDEFASGNLHREALSRLERLVNHRYGASMRTVLTTNADAEGLRAPEFARIYDRLREVAFVGACGEKSLRRKSA